MFAPRYFPERYFAPRYWPPGLPARPGGLPNWLRKPIVEDYQKRINAEKRKQYVKRIALLLLGD